MLEIVTQREVEGVFAVTDRMGLSREKIVIPLAPRHPGRVRLLPGGKIEIVVESEGELADFLAGLPAEINRLLRP